MSRQSLTWPISIIVAMLSVVALLLFSPVSTPNAAPLQQSCGVGYTVACTATTTATPTGATSTTTATTTATTGTASPTVTGIAASPTTTTASPSSSPTTIVTTQPAATLPPPTPVDGAKACFPGTTVYVEGRGPSYTAILLYFADKAVGGGTTNAAGQFRLALKIGPEKYGVYEVQARIRSSQRVLAKETCVVPYLTPTPTPLRRPPP